MRIKEYKPQFVEALPDNLREGKIYISMSGRCAVHLCPCGCGEKVYISFSPQLWQLIFDGKSITIYPSIGNFDSPCRSHYFIIKNKVVDCMSKKTCRKRFRRKHKIVFRKHKSKNKVRLGHDIDSS